MTLVVDSSLVVAVILNEGVAGSWAADLVESDELAAPHHLYSEVAGVLRRRTLAGEIDDDTAATAYSVMLAMSVSLYEFEPFAERIWQLRNTVIIKDPWFVALAETLDAPLATLDYRLSRAPGPRCRFLTPPA